MSGEHGDGRARSELLPRMYSPAAIALMQQAKRILDPDNLLNPGVLVDPAPFDADLRLAAPMRPVRTVLRLTHDSGSFGRRRPPVHWRRQVRRRQHGHGRGDVPVLPGDPRREGLHPGTRARPPGRRQRGPRLRRPGGRPGARPVPLVQGLRPGLPDRRRHGDLQVRGALPEVRRAAAPAIALRPGPAAPLGPPDAAEAGQRDAAQQARWPRGEGGRRGRPAAQPARVLRATAAVGTRTAPGERRRLDLGRLLHRPLRCRHRTRRDLPCWSPWGCARRSSPSPPAAA